VHDLDPDEQRYKLHTVCGTSARELGVITQSVGVELYFVFIKLLGLLFGVLFLLSLPMLGLNCLGNMVATTSIVNKVVSMTTIANIGVCPEFGCRSNEELAERCLWDTECTDDSWRVRDVARWLGLLDGVGIVLLVAFAVFFKKCIIPRLSKNFDQATHTPADYTVELRALPRMLGGDLKSEDHRAYEEHLKKHFLEVLRTMKQDPIDDEDAIARVTAVREYDGAISRFMEKGRLLHEITNHEVLKDKYGKDPKKERKVQKQEKSVQKKQDKVDYIEKKLRHQAELVDEERPVCLAFVTFSKEEYQQRIMDEYCFAQYSLFR